MSTPERLPRIPEQDDDSSTQKEANLSTATRPRTRSRTKRFEIGFFVRKVVNGWLAYYKQFPPRRSASTSSEEQAPPLMARSAPLPISMPLPEGDVERQASPGMGTGDPGPIGGTRFEVGMFASTSTETTASDDGGDSKDS